MDQQQKISIIIPCYNAGKYIREAVDSIVNQTYRNLEILLIDDGSVDDTKAIISEYAQQDKRVVPVFNDKNIGLIRTLNIGVKKTTGDFIARMDADDISVLNRIEILYNTFVTDPDIDVVSAAYYYLTVDGRVIRKAYPKATLSKALQFVSFFCTPVNHPCVMARAKVLKENAYDEIYIHSEDYELFSRLLNKGYHFKNLTEPLYYLRVNPESVSHKYEQIQISTHMRISVMNIENYFGQRYEYFTHKVMVNRISFDVSNELMKIAISTLENLKTIYIKQEQANDTEINEIKEFLVEQKIDIYLQTLKYAKWFRKPIVLMVIIMNLGVFLNKRGMQYFKLKFNYLFS